MKGEGVPMVNYIDKKGKFMSISADKWGEKNFRMRVTGGWVGMWDKRRWGDN